MENKIPTAEKFLDNYEVSWFSCGALAYEYDEVCKAMEGFANELLKQSIETIKWYMENTTPDNNDYQTFHDLGMNTMHNSEELIREYRKNGK